MKIKRIELKDFRRFTHLVIDDIPDTAKLVILSGPNGNGKSSIFDAMLLFYRLRSGQGWNGDTSYYHKASADASVDLYQRIDIKFHDLNAQSIPQNAIYVRTAYRNDASFQIQSMGRVGSATTENRFHRLIDNDAAVQSNYQRLVSQGLEAVYEKEAGETTISQFREKSIGKIQKSLEFVLPGLHLNSLGNPLIEGTFSFTKGNSQKYDYKNLSGGEKSVFDLILDYTIKQAEFNNTVFCIDEPEAHLNARIHGKVLRVLTELTEPQSQLWIATHSIGMLRYARDLERQQPGSVAILDFDIDADVSQTLKPAKMARPFWQTSLGVALDDVAALVAPSQIIACESGKKGNEPGEGVDAAIYNLIFSEEFPETRFVSIGSSTDLSGDRFLVVRAITNLLEGTTLLRLTDRDGMSDVEVSDAQKDGILVLTRRHIESYMFDDEVLAELCKSVGKVDHLAKLLDAKADARAAAQQNGHPVDHIKSASGRIADACRKILALQNAGKTTNAFMRDTLAPLISPSLAVYQDLKRDVFGNI